MRAADRWTVAVLSHLKAGLMSNLQVRQCREICPFISAPSRPARHMASRVCYALGSNSILLIVAAVLCLSFQSTARRDYNDFTNHGASLGSVRLVAEFPKEKPYLGFYPLQIGLDASPLLLAAASLSFAAGLGALYFSLRAIRRREATRVRSCSLKFYGSRS